MTKYKGTLIFDLDGTLCPIRQDGEDYADLVPFQNVVMKLKQCRTDGYRISIFTARNMKSYNGNLGLINANTAPKVIDWLNKWGIPFDEVIFGKPWPGDGGFYVDDRAVRPDEFINNSLEDLQNIVNNVQINLLNQETL